MARKAGGGNGPHIKPAHGKATAGKSALGKTALSNGAATSGGRTTSRGPTSRRGGAKPAAGSLGKRQAVARRALVTDRYRLEGTYERLRRAVAAMPDDGRLDRPLSYWVLPSDRRLPIAFLDQTLRELLAFPLESLMQTPGVGRKKILGFFDLVRRAQKAQSPDAAFGFAPEPPPATDPASARGVGAEFDPETVSEAVWEHWRHAIEQAGFQDHRLGRVAPSLRSLPTVIWDKTLGDYSHHTLEEIRAMKTHGQKRVHAILGVFHAVYEAVSTSALHEALQLDLASRRVTETQRWITRWAESSDSLTAGDVQTRIVRPLIEEIANDLGPDVAELAGERLGVSGGVPSVKEQADRRSITRARVYQLLEECSRVMHVRWPEGRWLLQALTGGPVRGGSQDGATTSSRVEHEAAELVHAVRALFYPA